MLQTGSEKSRADPFMNTRIILLLVHVFAGKKKVLKYFYPKFPLMQEMKFFSEPVSFVSSFWLILLLLKTEDLKGGKFSNHNGLFTFLHAVWTVDVIVRCETILEN